MSVQRPSSCGSAGVASIRRGAQVVAAAHTPRRQPTASVGILHRDGSCRSHRRPNPPASANFAVPGGRAAIVAVAVVLASRAATVVGHLPPLPLPLPLTLTRCAGGSAVLRSLFSEYNEYCLLMMTLAVHLGVVGVRVSLKPQPEPRPFPLTTDPEPKPNPIEP